MFKSRVGGAVNSIDDWKRCINPAQWADGRSAKLLAERWLGAGGFPATVLTALAGTPFDGATIKEAVIEHETPLPGKGRASCTDILVRLRLADGSAGVIAVEGKVNEPFGNEDVGTWRRGDPVNRMERLGALLDGLGIVGEDRRIDQARYQLLHRAFAAIVEAKSSHARSAALLVHSFDPVSAGLADFRFFARILGAGPSPVEPGVPVHLGPVGGVECYLMWVADTGGARRPARPTAGVKTHTDTTHSIAGGPATAEIAARSWSVEEALRPRVTAGQAEDFLRAVPHEHCQQGIGTRWQIDPDGLVRPQAMLWLFCWAATGQNSMEAARAAEHAFDAIMPVSFQMMRQYVPHEWARGRRYATGNIRDELAGMLRISGSRHPI